MDQWLVAACALVVFMAFGALAYILREERKSRILIERDPDTVETRSRRAF
jgi:hypothetical protein